MGITSFLKLVEIQTKVASIIPYLVGTVFALYKFDNFNMKSAILLFLSMIIFDMTVTAINNYVDYIKAIKKEGFGYEEHNAITKYGLKPKTVLGIIIVMLIVSSLFFWAYSNFKNSIWGDFLWSNNGIFYNFFSNIYRYI